MKRTLPGADKYRIPAAGDAPWDDPLVVRANTEVRIEDVLNDYFAMHVPAGAEGWKARCPLFREHDDGGRDRQFRVYASGNRGHCFALHGSVDPVRLWRLRSYHPTLRDAAEALLTAYGIDCRPLPYAERMAALQAKRSEVADPATVVETINVYLQTLPGYAAQQYDESVLRSVNLILNEVHEVCAGAEATKDVQTWLFEAKARLARAVLP